MEFRGFIGGFGKIFFTKGGIKREKEGFWEMGRGIIQFRTERIIAFVVQILQNTLFLL